MSDKTITTEETLKSIAEDTWYLIQDDKLNFERGESANCKGAVEIILSSLRLAYAKGTTDA
jgi:hypothetical protein